MSGAPTVERASGRGARHQLRWVLLTVLLGAVALALGAVAGLRAGYREVPSADQQETLGEFGAPPAWIVVEATAEADSARYEQWFYADDGRVVTFLSGETHGQIDVTFTDVAIFDVRSPVSPVDLLPGMTARDVDALVGATGVEAEPLETDLGVVTTFVYPDAALMVQFLDGYLYTAVTV